MQQQTVRHHFSPIERALISAATFGREQTADQITEVLEAEKGRDALETLRQLSQGILERAFTMVAGAKCHDTVLAVRAGADSPFFKKAQFLGEKRNLLILRAAFLQVANNFGFLQNPKEQDSAQIYVQPMGLFNKPYVVLGGLATHVASYIKDSAYNKLQAVNAWSKKYD